jgi:hypothetical protein
LVPSNYSIPRQLAAEPIGGSRFGALEDPVNRFLKPVILLVATVYFVVDAVLMVAFRPVADWLAKLLAFCGLKTWIASLRPYPTLALFAVPLVVLEPAKPFAAYLAATGHVAAGLMVFGCAEILKLVFLERLFSVSRDKLLSIPTFAWLYGEYRRIVNVMTQTPAWQAASRWSKIVQYSIRGLVLQLKRSQKPARISYQR